MTNTTIVTKEKLTQIIENEVYANYDGELQHIDIAVEKILELIRNAERDLKN